MKRESHEYQQIYDVATRTACAVGKILRDGFNARKRTHEVSHHDIKLEMDVRAQEFIYRSISRVFPEHELLGEEDTAYHGGKKSTTGSAKYRWVIDPLDGTVNYFYNIPHYCTSIACQRRKSRVESRESRANEEWETIVGAIYDPSTDELFSAQKGGPSLLNGRPIRVSSRSNLR